MPRSTTDPLGYGGKKEEHNEVEIALWKIHSNY